MQKKKKKKQLQIQSVPPMIQYARVGMMINIISALIRGLRCDGGVTNEILQSRLPDGSVGGQTDLEIIPLLLSLSHILIYSLTVTDRRIARETRCGLILSVSVLYI